MTSKEKARWLVDKFMKPIDGFHKYPMCFDTAKQCAIIAVDEIIETKPTYESSSPFLGTRTYSNVNYWENVKKEIELIYE